MSLPNAQRLGSMGNFLDHQRQIKQVSEQQPEPPKQPSAIPTTPAATKPRSTKPRSETKPRPIEAAPASSASDGGSVKTTVSIPVSCLERLRKLAASGNVSQADALVVELARYGRTAEPEATNSAQQIAGGFVLTGRPSSGEPRTILSLRISRRNLDVMDELQRRLNLSSRSELVARALTP